MRRAAAIVLLGFCAGSARAQSAGLGLVDALRMTLARSPDIAVARDELEVSRGALEAARGAFDLTLTARLGQRRDDDPGIPASAGQAAIAPSTTYTTTWEVGASQLFRSGLRVEPRVQVSRLAGSQIDPPYGPARLVLGVTQPLLRGRGSDATGAPEDAAAIAERAARLRVGQTVAERGLAVVLAYFTAREAWETVRILTGAEERAAQLLDEERRLVEARERAPADLHQIRASLEDARANRIDAERAYREARQSLGLAMGLGWVEIDALPPPADALDLVTSARAPVAADMAPLVALALERRLDLEASRADLEAEVVLARAARRNLEPELDLLGEIGWGGQSVGGGAGPLVTSIGENVVGPSFFVGLALSYPPANRAARGALRQEEARRHEREIAARDRTRTIAAGVALAASVLETSLRSLASAQAAVDDYTLAKDNELRKLHGNLSTDFDVLAIESRLTSAQLSAVRARGRVAQAIARLRFEAGVLVEPGADLPTLEQLLSVPAPR